MTEGQQTLASGPIKPKLARRCGGRLTRRTAHVHLLRRRGNLRSSGDPSLPTTHMSLRGSKKTTAWASEPGALESRFEAISWVWRSSTCAPTPSISRAGGSSTEAVLTNAVVSKMPLLEICDRSILAFSPWSKRLGTPHVWTGQFAAEDHAA